MSDNSRIAKNTMFLYVRMVVVMAMNLYTSRLVLQALGIDDYGLYNVVGGIVLLFSIINNALSSGTSRFITFELGKNNLKRLRYTFSASFYIHLMVAMVVLLFAETIGLWYINNVLVVAPERVTAANWVYQFSIVTCMFSLTQVPYSATIIAHENMSIYAWVGICEAVFKLAMVLFLVYVAMGDKLILYGLLTMFWGVCVQCFYRVYCGRNYVESRLCWVSDKSYYKTMLSFSLWDVLGAFTVQGYSQGVSILMNYFFSLAINAAKGIAFQVQTVVNMFCSNFLTAVRPQIVKLFAEGNIDKMKRLVYESSRISYFLLLIVALPLCIEANYVLKLWLKEVPEKTELFMVLILIYALTRTFAGPIVQAVHATGNIKQLNIYCGGASIAINLPLTYIAYKSGAPSEATFYILLLSSLVCNYLELHCLKKEIQFSILHYTLDVYVRCLFITFPAILVSYIIGNTIPESFVRLLIVTFTNTMLIGMFAFYGGISNSTRREVIKMIKVKSIK